MCTMLQAQFIFSINTKFHCTQPNNPRGPEARVLVGTGMIHGTRLTGGIQKVSLREIFRLPERGNSIPPGLQKLASYPSLTSLHPTLHLDACRHL